jgi:hypothetical protein
MSAHLSEELPRLLTGEASRDAVLAAAEHLRTCVDCQHELVSAVVAHASLTSAQRFAPEIVARAPMGNFAQHSDDSDESDEQRSDATLPDLSAVFAQVRREADEGFHGEREPSTARRRYLVAAAAAVVVAGAGTGIYLATTGGGGTGTATRTVSLRAFDKGTTSAVAHIGNGTIDLTATSLPTLAAKRYEVWLTDSGRTRMQPIGWIGNNGTAHLTVPTVLMSRFNDIEVSVQNMGARSYNYSGTSVLRGAID